MKDFFLFVVLPGVVALLIVVAIFAGCLVADYYGEYFTHSNAIEVAVDGKIVYEGASFYCDVASGGATTSVVIFDRRFPICHVSAKYLSNDVHVRPK